MTLKRWIVVLMTALLLFGTACESAGHKTSGGADIVKPGENTTPEINILVTPNVLNWMKNESFQNYNKEFEKQYGVKVKYQTYGETENREDGKKELFTKLLTKDGPELIMDDTQASYDFIKQGAAMDVSSKIKNLEKIYKTMISEQTYYVPIGMYYSGMMLREDALKALKLTAPDVNWTEEEYYRIYDKWISTTTQPFTRYEYFEILHRYFGPLELFDLHNKKANLNSAELKSAIENMRKKIFSGSFVLKKGYGYENYYNMIYEYTSEEYSEDRTIRTSKAYKEQSLRVATTEGITNILYSKDVDLRRSGKLVVLPNCMTESTNIWTLGFIVNKNGKDLELAYEYINGLLSDELQQKIYEDEELDIYPVNQGIENDISKIEDAKGYSEEAKQIRGYVLDKIKKGEFVLTELSGTSEVEMFEMFIKDMMPFIFAEQPYSDSELSVKLKELENKYNILLNE